MKPIEEGCLALIIVDDGANSGTVTVGRFIGKPDLAFDDSDYWEVDRPMMFSDGKTYCYLRESHLMRIDDEEFEDECETEKGLIGETS